MSLVRPLPDGVRTNLLLIYLAIIYKYKQAYSHTISQQITLPLVLKFVLRGVSRNIKSYGPHCTCEQYNGMKATQWRQTEAV